MADDQAARAAAPPNLELKQLGRDAKNLKHKHKSKRPHQPRGDGGACSAAKSGELKRSPSAASPGRHHVHGKRSAASSKSSREDALRELLAGKIAEIEVGGDENLENPIALAGAKAKACIYQDEKLPTQTLEAAGAVVANDALTADEKVAALADSLKLAVRSLSQREVQLVAMKRELSAQFQKTIEEVSSKMDQQGKDYVASLKENENLQQKLKSFLEQYTMREEHFQRQLETKDLTVQLAETKLKHQVELTARESERVTVTLEKAKEFSDREVQLQAQLNSYSEKFDVVQETLAKSNQMFGTFREEMDKMAKATKKLEKENLALKKKCAAYDNGAIATIQEKVASAEETQKLQEKLKKLESLCRHLQAERNSIRQGQQQMQPAAATESA
ncbi:hypothetical protein BBJ28_00016879 [Nothophytophthora sp. Chile5]|nr:hypothetical protein BBJ28_00016879 [Nothophytophthora sp. Chile5]